MLTNIQALKNNLVFCLQFISCFCWLTVFHFKYIELVFWVNFIFDFVFYRGLVPLTSPCIRCSSSSFLVWSSNALISSIVIPCHLSVQQKTCRWKFKNNRFSVEPMKLSTLFCKPNHLNSTVTNLWRETETKICKQIARKVNKQEFFVITILFSTLVFWREKMICDLLFSRVKKYANQLSKSKFS